MNSSDQPSAGNHDDLSSDPHRQLIGYVGLGLPFLLWIIAGLRPAGQQPWVLMGSISAYYYSGAVSVFAGMLFVLGLFLFAYRGYANRYYLRDRAAALIAGGAAILIAVFPTAAPDVTLALAWWTPRTGTIHLVSAAILFSSFIFFSLFQFPLSSVEKGQPLPRGKKIRNIIYRICGIAIAACMLWVIYAVRTGAPIFWPEALALEFFAVSWLVKGRVDKTAVQAGRKSLYYLRHPQEMIHKAKDADRSEPGIQQTQ